MKTLEESSAPSGLRVKNEFRENMKKVFISHSSQDSEIVGELIEIIEAAGLVSDKIFCTSYDGYGIPPGADFLSAIKQELSADSLVIFVLSENFYSSPISLCEMGATWVLTKEHIPILIPPTDYEDIKGVIPLTQGMKINEPLKLNLLKEKIENLFQLENPVNQSVWEQKRDKILERVEETLIKRAEYRKATVNDLPSKNADAIPKLSLEILLFCSEFREGVSVSEVQQKFDISSAKAELELGKLEKEDLIDYGSLVMGQEIQYVATHEGRELLDENNLL